MNSTWLKRLGAASGTLYVVLAFLRNGGGTSPNFHATQQEIIDKAKQGTDTVIDTAKGLLDLLH